MEILIGNRAGFCDGIKRAIEETEKELNKNGKLCCLGELTHNPQILQKLNKKGLKIVETVEEGKESAKLIIRAHGVSKEIYEEANKLKIELLDLTCPKVLKIHYIAEEYSKNGYYILLIGEKNHPEVIGTFSFCGENASIIETEQDFTAAFENLRKTNIKKVLVISQTTFNLEKFKKYEKIITDELKGYELQIKNSICVATKLRQEETEKLAQEVDYMIIIGGKKSSNTKKLYDISKQYCTNAIHLETKEEININEVKKYNKIGIMAGASTPKDSIEGIVNLLKGIK